MEIETVRIVAPVVPGNPHGYVVINKSDFDAERHALWVEGAPADALATDPAADAIKAADPAASAPLKGRARPALAADAEKAAK